MRIMMGVHYIDGHRDDGGDGDGDYGGDGNGDNSGDGDVDDGGKSDHDDNHDRRAMTKAGNRS